MICNVFPEIMLNGNIFDNIPSHWELSTKHISDLNNKIESLLSSIKEFHGDTVILNVLRNIQIDAIVILVLHIWTFVIYFS